MLSNDLLNQDRESESHGSKHRNVRTQRNEKYFNGKNRR